MMTKHQLLQAAKPLLRDLDELECFIYRYPAHRDFTYTAMQDVKELCHVARFETQQHMTVEQVRHFFRIQEEVQKRLFKLKAAGTS